MDKYFHTAVMVLIAFLSQFIQAAIYSGGPVISNLSLFPESKYENLLTGDNENLSNGLLLINNASLSDNNPSGQLLWQAVKSNFPFGVGYVIHIRITISDMIACFLKGPDMADFTPAVWVQERGQWSLEIKPLTLSQLQSKSLGTWQLKLTNNDDQETIYSFTISGALLSSEFLPLPTLIEPANGASNVIAQHNTIRWNPNGAQTDADALIVDIGGNSFNYVSNTLDLSATSWNPGWLEIGNAYCKVAYTKYRPDMIDVPVLVSGYAIDWESQMASLVSGPYHTFAVKYSLDFIDDNSIDLSDLEVFCSHWLEPAPSIADFDNNGIVNFDDFSIFSQHWFEDTTPANMEITVELLGIEPQPVDEYLASLHVSVSDPEGELIGGSIEIAGPVDTDAFPLDQNFCQNLPGDDLCDLQGSLLTFDMHYFLHGENASWNLTFTVTNNLTQTVGKTIAIPHP